MASIQRLGIWVGGLLAVWGSLLVSPPLHAADEVLSQPLSPQEGLKSIKVREGFTVDLVAAEPAVMDPVALDWGPDGKLWVVEMADYPSGLDGTGKFGGRVRFLEDADGDGTYEKSVVFLDGLGYPSGVMPWRKGVLISCAPDILYAEDTDGDGRADKKESLYKGFGEGNQQHRVNGFWWGLDNWIYCANGDSGGRIESAKTGEKVDISNRDFRLRPDLGLIQTASGQTQFGRASDDWGNWFGCSNSEPSFYYALEDHYLRRNPHLLAPNPKVQVSVAPGAAPIFPTSRTVARFNDHNKANRFTSACGLSFYRDDLFGPEFAGNSFVSEPVHNLVHREVVASAGTVFTSQRPEDERSSEFLTSTDNWFRPTMTRTGPDGGLWVTDMYRLVIEHPQWIPPEWQARLDLRAGHDCGRIYRIRPTGKKLRPIPRFDRMTTGELVAALDSPNGWQRDMAQRQLVWLDDPAAIEPLRRLAMKSQLATARLHALCTLEGCKGLTPELLTASLADADPGVRRHAVRLAESFLEKPDPAPSSALSAAILARGDDENAMVRMQLAYSLGQWNDPRAGQALGKLALSARDDRFLTAAVMSSALTNLDQVIVTVLAGDGKSPPSAALVESLLGMASANSNSKAVGSLAVAIATPAADGRYAPWQFSALAGLLDTLDRRNTTLAQYQNAAGADLKPALGKLADVFSAARKKAADDKTPVAERLTALRLLGRGAEGLEEDLQRLSGLLLPQVALELQTAAVAALGRLRDPQVPQRLVAGWKAFGPRVRGEVLGVLLSRNEWNAAVLDGIEQGLIQPADIDAASRGRLIQHKDEAVRNRSAKLLAVGTAADRQKVIDQYQSALKLTGDATRGGELFVKKCGVCHQLQGKGHPIGPDLTALTDKSAAAMLTAILDPNKAVEAKFVNYVAVTSSGLIQTGMLASESGGSITLAQAEGKTHSILRGDLESLESTGKSLMPEGMEKDLTPQDMADVIAHLAATGPARKLFAGNTPEVVRPESLRGEFFLLAKHCEIYGGTLVFEAKYGNLGYWQSENDAAQWTLEVTQAGEYSVSLDYACPADAAGKEFVLETGGQRLPGKVPSTGSWDAYGRLDAGRLTLSAGRQRLAIRPSGKISGPLMDLKSIGLRPVK